MGKPIAGRDQFPYGVDGIIVSGAKLSDGTVLKNIHISKQRSVLVFDLTDGTNLYQKLSITSKDANGAELDLNGDDDVLAASLKPGTFYVRAVNSSNVKLGYVIRFQLKKVIVSNGSSVFDMDYTKGTDGIVDVTGVTLNKSTGTGKVGSTDQLTATVAPSTATNKALTWASSAPSIATVSASGLVSFIANGSATITVSTVDGSKTATCAYTVTTAVTGVTVAPSTVTLAVAGTQQLTPTVAPSTASNKAVTYSSSATGVATVSASGLITAVATGSATITVTTADGAKTATCVVTVS